MCSSSDGGDFYGGLGCIYVESYDFFIGGRGKIMDFSLGYF